MLNGETIRLGSFTVLKVSNMTYTAWRTDKPDIRADGESIDEAVMNCVAVEKGEHDQRLLAAL